MCVHARPVHCVSAIVPYRTQDVHMNSYGACTRSLRPDTKNGSRRYIRSYPKFEYAVCEGYMRVPTSRFRGALIDRDFPRVVIARRLTYQFCSVVSDASTWTPKACRIIAQTCKKRLLGSKYEGVRTFFGLVCRPGPWTVRVQNLQEVGSRSCRRHMENPVRIHMYMTCTLPGGTTLVSWPISPEG